MKVLRLIVKWFCRLWHCGHNSAGIDSHKWESKIEIHKHLSR